METIRTKVKTRSLVTMKQRARGGPGKLGTWQDKEWLQHMIRVETANKEFNDMMVMLMHNLSDAMDRHLARLEGVLSRSRVLRWFLG